MNTLTAAPLSPLLDRLFAEDEASRAGLHARMAQIPAEQRAAMMSSKTDYRALLRTWLAGMPEEWGFVEENRTEPVRGAALPMGFNRTPHYYNGLLLAGDAGGLVNPFNGEGIAYAMESGEILARTVVQAMARRTDAQTENVLRHYPKALQDAYGGYYSLGRVFVKLIGQPKFMRYATKKGMDHPTLMRFALKLLANLTEPRGGDAMDRVINAMTKVAPHPE